MDDETEACRSDADVMLQIIEEDDDELDFVWELDEGDANEL